MEFDSERVRRQLSKYKFRDLTMEELMKVNMFYPNFRFSMDTYVFKDSSQKDLLNFTGTIPVNYQGNTYNIPIHLWILDSHPFAPPICFLKPTPNMGISVGKHVDAQGRIYLPYLQNWSHPKSVITGLISEMIIKFQEELPLYSLSASDEAQQVELLAYISKITQGISDINSKSQENKSVNKITVVGSGELGIACVLSILAKGYYNINSEVFLSLPCILGDKGVYEVIKATAKEDVTEKLQSSASSLYSLQSQLKL
ncbi:ubiquitin-conjugating enzyme E2 variant 3 isoform X3 [Antechinus flavipes]|uniref:ubiquitin-conjugating enzyme E2 variant 3 isoform X3 n=1 Tax=Antechinus flavipes TaxID=38775 RepID=UPI002235A6E7|nr:ubiquitin-conjugating enzyme E2 variant 3 isoform X3 [Antechinus flavipes]